MTMRRILPAICLAALLACLAPAAAMSDEGTERKVAISINPILAMFTWYTGEIEFAVGPTMAAGVSGSYLAFGDEDDGDEETYANGTVFVRYYPQATFKGFFFGLCAGYYRVTDQELELVGDDDSEGVMGAGIDIGYSWLLGRDERMYVSVGAGAMRLFGGDLDASDVVLPTIRLINVGFAF